FQAASAAASVSGTRASRCAGAKLGDSATAIAANRTRRGDLMSVKTHQPPLHNEVSRHQATDAPVLCFGLCSGKFRRDAGEGEDTMSTDLDLDEKIALLMSLAAADREGMPGRDPSMPLP